MMLPPIETISQLDDVKEWSIKDVARILVLNASTLRSWEGQFAELNPRRTRSGHRSYSKADIERIWVVKYLLYVQEFSNGGASRKLTEFVKYDLSIEEMVARFESMWTESVEPEEHEAIRELAVTRAEELVALETDASILQKKIEQLKGQLANTLSELEVQEKQHEELKAKYDSLLSMHENLQSKYEALSVKHIDTEYALRTLLSIRNELSSIRDMALTS